MTIVVERGDSFFKDYQSMDSKNDASGDSIAMLLSKAVQKKDFGKDLIPQDRAFSKIQPQIAN